MAGEERRTCPLFMLPRSESVRVLHVVYSPRCGDGAHAPTAKAPSSALTTLENGHVSGKRLVVSAVTDQMVKVGEPIVVQSDSPIGRYQAVFEDDGETGYFYALDTSRSDNPIVDALHIYNVKDVTDRDKPSQLHIVWSADGRKTALFLNSYPHAVYDFENGRGCCRTGFPPAATGSHDWDEAAMEHFHGEQ